MSNDKIKTYKNPLREIDEEHKPYVPQYQILGRVPGEIGTFPAAIAVNQLPMDNPRALKPVIRHSFPTNSLPNIGNNMDTWASLDEDEYDFKLDPSHPMIDNNEFIDLPSEDKVVNNTFNKYGKEDILSSLESLKENEYLLIVDGTVICSGELEKVQTEAGDLLFGDHILCDGKAVPIDNIIVIKKAQIKVGLFLD